MYRAARSLRLFTLTSILCGLLVGCGTQDSSTKQSSPATETASKASSPTTDGFEQGASESPAGSAQTATGLDVSHFQNTIDWQAVAANDQYSFAIVKATEGIDALDGQFKANWSELQRVGLIRGAYHFFEPKDDANQQVDFFLGTVGDFEPGDLPPILDIELSRDVEPEKIVQGIQTWLEAVEKATGRVPIIYTGWKFWNSLGTDAFARYPLWLSEYEVTQDEIVVPDGWSTWTFWQYTEKGQVPGIEGDIDLNRFAGSRQDLERFVGATP